MVPRRQLTHAELAILAHNLKKPLTVIRVQVQLAHRRSELDGETAALILQEADRAIAMLDEALARFPSRARSRRAP